MVMQTHNDCRTAPPDVDRKCNVEEERVGEGGEGGGAVEKGEGGGGEVEGRVKRGKEKEKEEEEVEKEEAMWEKEEMTPPLSHYESAAGKEQLLNEAQMTQTWSKVSLNICGRSVRLAEVS